MSKKEAKRAVIITKLLEGLYTNKEAADLLGLSVRQVIRLKKEVRLDGIQALAHKNRGRKPVHAIPKEIRRRVVQLAVTKYHGSNYTHLAELLERYEGISLSVSSVRRILRQAGIGSSKKRRANKKHRLRERQKRFGALLQLDGSIHNWLGDQHQAFTLVAAIDDATGKIVAARFCERETTADYMLLMKNVINTYGIPLAVYTDRHSIFQSTKTGRLSIEEELEGKQVPLTQFGRALEELGVTHFAAHSPQAKGRIERLFGTLQSRWVIELRMLGIESISQANEHLPHLVELFNRRFAVKAAEEESAFLPLPPNAVLDNVLCIKVQRKLKGGVLSYQGKKYRCVAVNSGSAPVSGVITVIHGLNGTIKAQKGTILYHLEPFAEPPRKDSSVQTKKAGLRTPHKPAPNHPWRQYPRNTIIAHGDG